MNKKKYLKDNLLLVVFWPVVIGLSICAYLVISYFFCPPENEFFTGSCQAKDNLSLFVGAIIGAVVSFFFFWVDKKQKETQHLLDLIREIQMAPNVTAYNLGQHVFLISNLKDTDGKFEVFLGEIKKLCEGLSIQETYGRAALVQSKDKGILELMAIFEDAIFKKYGHPTEGSFGAGIDMMMFSTQAGSNQQPVSDFIARFLIRLESIRIEEPIRDYIKKSFEEWTNQKISSKEVLLFLDLIDHYFRFQGSLSPNVIKLRSFLSTKTLPSKKNFDEKSNELLQTFRTKK